MYMFLMHFRYFILSLNRYIALKGFIILEISIIEQYVIYNSKIQLFTIIMKFLNYIEKIHTYIIMVWHSPEKKEKLLSQFKLNNFF